MKRKKKKPEPGQGVPEEGLSPEMEAFENFAKKVLSVPKDELDRREAQLKNEPPKRTSE